MLNIYNEKHLKPVWSPNYCQHFFRKSG